MRLLKKLFKWAAGLVAVVLVLAGAAFIHVWYFKPLKLDWFLGREFLQFAMESPETLSSLRMLEQFGIKGHQDELDDESMAAGDRMLGRLREAHKTLLSYEDEDLNAGDLLSKRIARSILDPMVESAEKFRFHTYPVNQLFGVQNGFPSFMESTHQVNNRRDAEDYVARLNKVGVKFDQVIDGLRHRESLGILPPQFVVERVLEEMRNFVAEPIEDNILYSSLEQKMGETELSEQDREQIGAAAADAIRDSVHPAYQRLIGYFEELQPKAQGNHGVWKLPDGDQLYKLALRLMTTTDYTADEIHRTGLSEVARIQAEILSILATENWDTSGGFEPAIAALADDPRFYYSDTDEGRQQILEDYRQMIEEISGGLSEAFDVMPKASVEVERIPEFKEKTSPGAYYQGPAMDGSRPGVFYANLYDIKATPKYSMRTLAYHEAVPGHHFQIAITQEQEDLPLFRRFGPFTAYVEGWALYAEQVAWELGFQDDPYDNIGRLQAELFRAVRLVVDTGIHAKQWSREQAIDYMIANTGMAESDVISEIERYFVMPGQATAYKVGMMKILELREKAKRELGSSFDLRQFHNVVLTNGAVPLTILEELIDQYIAEQQTG